MVSLDSSALVKDKIAEDLLPGPSYEIDTSIAISQDAPTTLKPYRINFSVHNSGFRMRGPAFTTYGLDKYESLNLWLQVCHHSVIQETGEMRT